MENKKPKMSENRRAQIQAFKNVQERKANQQLQQVQKTESNRKQGASFKKNQENFKNISVKGAERLKSREDLSKQSLSQQDLDYGINQIWSAHGKKQSKRNKNYKIKMILSIPIGVVLCCVLYYVFVELAPSDTQADFYSTSPPKVYSMFYYIFCGILLPYSTYKITPIYKPHLSVLSVVLFVLFVIFGYPYLEEFDIVKKATFFNKSVLVLFSLVSAFMILLPKVSYLWERDILSESNEINKELQDRIERVKNGKK